MHVNRDELDKVAPQKIDGSFYGLIRTRYANESLLYIRIVFGRLGASIWPASRIVFGHPAAFNFGRSGALIWPANRTFLAA